jgi:hypothetical protein
MEGEEEGEGEVVANDSQDEEGDTVGHNGQDEEEEKEDDSYARWTRLEVEEAAEEAALARKEERAWTRAQAHAEAYHPFTDDEEDLNDHSSDGGSSSSDALTASTSSQEVTSSVSVRMTRRGLQIRSS